MDDVLATDRLTKRFRHVTAVNAVSFAVARGEAFGILGRNGAGKSTLIKMLTTLLPPSSGSASIAGHDLTHDAATVRRLIGYVPQGLSSDPDLTARENLQILAALYDIPRSRRRERIQSTLALVGLEDAANRLVKTYSGGMTRRLEIGQAMLHQPPLLFLDEPTVGLDPVAREAIWRHVHQLRAELGVAVCLTTHYMDEAEHLCSRFLVLQNGAAVSTGSIAQLRTAAGLPQASLDELFGYFTGDAIEQERHDAPIGDSAPPPPGRRTAVADTAARSATVLPWRFLTKTLAIASMEVRKLRHDPMELLTRAIQPLLWLLIFGQVFGRLHALPTGDLTYTEFLAPGILAQSVLFVAIFYGIAVIWERDLGIVHKFLASPTPRAALVSGKAVSAGIRALSQALIVYVASLALGVRMNLTPHALLGVLFFVMTGAALFATFSLIIASLVKTRERFMGIGQVLTMPLFFASNAIYPTSIMPGWLTWIVAFNPLTYEVDGLRALMLAGGVSGLGLGLDALVLLAALAVLVGVAARVYPRIIV